jgi:hypothetical protein
MRDPREYEKHAWLILFVLGILTVISAPIGVLGIHPNPSSPPPPNEQLWSWEASAASSRESRCSNACSNLGGIRRNMAAPGGQKPWTW